MQTLVSQDLLLSLGRGPVTSVITMQVLAYVLSVCSTVDAFLALAFRGTFTTASILTFLTFGPMVDMKSTLMFAGVFRPAMASRGRTGPPQPSRPPAPSARPERLQPPLTCVRAVREDHAERKRIDRQEGDTWR